jgi:Tol biopolymer transport system component
MTYTRVTTAYHDNRSSGYPSLSADARVVALSSGSDFLDQGIAPGQWEIWLYDTATMTYTRITTASHDYRDSSRPSLSADGSVVAFVSDSDFLSQGIPNEQLEIWLYDTATMTYTRVTTATGSGERTSWNPILSADGSVVAFSSDSDFLGQGIPPGQLEIWLCDTSTMTYTRVTAASDGRDSWLPPSLSADGSVVAFTSDSDFLGQGISPGQWEIWLYRRFGPEHWLYLPLVMRDAP